MVYDLFRNFAPDFGYKVTFLVSFGHPISGTKLHSLFLLGTRNTGAKVTVLVSFWHSKAAHLD